MDDTNATQIWSLILRITGTVTGLISLSWQIARQLIADRQHLTLQPNSMAMGKPRSSITRDGPAVVIHPTKFYVKCANTGRRRIVLDELRVLDAKTKAQLGKRYLRDYEPQEGKHRSDPQGFNVEVEELRVVEVNLVGDSDHFVPNSQSEGYIEAVTSRARTFHSAPFFFSEVTDTKCRSIIEV
jgi:hypothetical protein